MKKTLFIKDAKDRLRVVYLSMLFNENDSVYKIIRKSGLFSGKIVDHPIISISEGKRKRTVKEQAELEFNAELRKYVDKGYKELKEDIEGKTEEEVLKLLPEQATDSEGRYKPMLAKSIKDLSEKTLSKVDKWLVSRKIDGNRVLIYWADGEAKTISRGGKNYDYSSSHILQHPILIAFFKKYPNIILDGELYIHGKPLQYINGLCNTKIGDRDKCNALEFWLFDIINTKDLKLIAKERVEFIKNTVEKELNVSTNLLNPFNDADLKVRVLSHNSQRSRINFKDLHDSFVEEGYEGLIARDADSIYRFGAKTSSMVKMKEYEDAEAIIIGKAPGTREIEDMVFILEYNSKVFKASPMGDYNQKKWYWDNFETECLGKKCVFKYFKISTDGIPTQPKFKCIRHTEDLPNE